MIADYLDRYGYKVWLACIPLSIVLSTAFGPWNVATIVGIVHLLLIAWTF